jgi:hypothetical protein
MDWKFSFRRLWEKFTIQKFSFPPTTTFAIFPIVLEISLSSIDDFINE